MSFVLIDNGKWLIVVAISHQQAQKAWEDRASILMKSKYESVNRFEVYAGTKLVNSMPALVD